MFWLNIIKTILNFFQSNQDPDEIAAGIALGSIVGLTPFNTLQNYIVLFLVFLLNVQRGAALFGILFFSLLGNLVDPLGHRLGYFLLTGVPALLPFWTALYNMPIIPFTRFNNTVVLGNLIVSLFLFIPIWVGGRKAIIKYRQTWKPKISKWKVIQILETSKWFEIYRKVKGRKK